MPDVDALIAASVAADLDAATPLRACARGCCLEWSEGEYCSEVCAAVDRSIAAWWPDKREPVATMGYGAAVAQAGDLGWLDIRCAS